MGISATKILVSEPTKIPTGFSAGSRTPAAKILAGVLAKFPLGFLALSKIPAAKISVGSRWKSHQDPAGIHGGEQKLGGQNLGGQARQRSRHEAKSRRPKSRRDPSGNPAKIPPGFMAGAKTRQPKSRRAIPPVLSARSKIPAAKISAGPSGNPGGIPPRSRQDPGGFFTRVCYVRSLWDVLCVQQANSGCI